MSLGIRMANGNTQGEVVLAADGTPLKESLNKAMRKNRIRALMLVAPLFIFILFSFLIPILDMTFRSVDNWQVGTLMPNTSWPLKIGMVKRSQKSRFLKP